MGGDFLKYFASEEKLTKSKINLKLGGALYLCD